MKLACCCRRHICASGITWWWSCRFDLRPRIAGKKRADVWEQDATHLKYFNKLAPLLERLHNEACARDQSGNRELHYTLRPDMTYVSAEQREG